jgi:hypothetical protein
MSSIKINISVSWDAMPWKLQIKCMKYLQKFFYDRVTVHRNRFLVNKTNRCNESHFYWYYYSTCFGQPFCPSSGILRMELSSILLLVTNGHNCIVYQSRCTAKNSWWWAERLPETCTIVTPVKLEFSASVGFIH